MKGKVENVKALRKLLRGKKSIMNPQKYITANK